MRGPLVTLALASGLSGAATAQGSAGYTPDPDERSGFLVVAAGEHYSAGGLHQLLLGRQYRGLWAARIQAPVLDLGSYAGGLSPEKEGGGQQTRSLHFESADGRKFAFRSLDKDPAPALQESLRETVVARIARDQTSALHPGAALAATVLVRAVGVLEAAPRLVAMPDDERLGEHRDEFAGLLGLIELRPVDGFAESSEVDDSDDLFEKLRESPSHRVDAAGFLAARLVDQVIGDWDRHSGQWRWAAYPGEGGTLWRPIPRDRDQAFVQYDGLLLSLARKLHPKLVVFRPEYSDLIGLTTNGSDLDRALLPPLDAADFDSVARVVQAALTDSVLREAVDRMPAPYREHGGEWLFDALRHRRDALPGHAARYYRMLATDVDVWATDRAEVADARWDAGALTLQVREAGADAPYYARRFDPRETEEVRLHLRGGDDRVDLQGRGRGVRLRVVRGPGRDSIAAAEGAAGVAIHDYIPEPEGEESSAVAETPVRDWGRSSSIGPRGGYDPDLGVLLGGQARRTDYAFRKEPYGSRVGLAVTYSTAADGFRVDLTADLRQRTPRTRFDVLARASQIETVRFNGLGNETPDGGEAAEVDRWQLTLAPSVVYAASDRLRVRGGPVLRHTAEAGGRFGMAAAAELGGEAPNGTRRSGRIEAGAGFFPVTWSGPGTFGEVHGRATGYLPLPLPGAPVLALRVGGKRVWGPFPFDEAAFLGGHGTLRGYDYHRFAGDAMVYGGGELGVPIARVLPHFVPTRIEVFGLADAGRVWAEGPDSRRLHAAAGGGVRLSFFEPANALSLAWASGREGDRWYLRWGQSF